MEHSRVVSGDAARDWRGLRVCVAGVGVSGDAAARALLAQGAAVTVLDAREGGDECRRGEALERLGATVRLGSADHLPRGTQLVVTSPGWRPTAPLLTAAADAGVPVLGEVELAWRLRPGVLGEPPESTDPAGSPERVERAGPAPWLALTGTNGKTTTVRMLASILRAAGRRVCAAGNVGTPLVDAVLADPPYEVLAVELSSFQLHWARSLRPFAAAILNLAPDHLDWHGSLAEYAADKARIYRGDPVAVYNVDDPWCTRLAAACRRRAGFTLEQPGPGELGLVGSALVDRAFVADPCGPPEELAEVGDLHSPAPHHRANGLAAAALARAYGVAPSAVRAGLRDVRPEPHRTELVTVVDGVRYVDDSKATNPHAAAASLASGPPVVWIAGGQLKGADVDELVASSTPRVRAAVVIGEGRAAIRDAFRRHAPDVPLVEVTSTDTDAMRVVVREAARLAEPGDTVLLAPAGASFDMFSDYAARGEAFATAVRLLAEGRL